MKTEDIDNLRMAWYSGTWKDGTPVDISVEWVLYFKLEELIRRLDKLIELIE